MHEGGRAVDVAGGRGPATLADVPYARWLPSVVPPPVHVPRLPDCAPPRPVAFVYPFDEARRLLAACRRLRDDLETLVVRHDHQLDDLFPIGRVGFQGRLAEAFLDVVTDQLELAEREIALLDQTIVALGVAIRDAEHRDAAWRRDLAAWQRATR